MKLDQLGIGTGKDEVVGSSIQFIHGGESYDLVKVT